MALTGLGTARHRKCMKCPGGFFMLKPPLLHGACVALGYEVPRQQDAALYDDAKSTCPVEYWAEVAPVDLEAERAAARAASAAAQVAKLQPLIAEIAPTAKTTEEVRAVVSKFVAAGMASASAAAEIEKNIVDARKELPRV